MITNDVAARIKTVVKERGYRIGDFLRECGMGVNALSQMAKAQDVSASTLVVIADRLSCSVDYLLGRTSSPGVVPDGFDLSEEEQELISYFRRLNATGRRHVLNSAEAERDAIAEKGAAATIA